MSEEEPTIQAGDARKKQILPPLMLIAFAILGAALGGALIASNHLDRSDAPPMNTSAQDSPLPVQLWVLRRLVADGLPSESKRRELLDTYMSSTPDKRAAFEELLIRCATAAEHADAANRSECARRAMSTTYNKGATAAALARSFPSFDISAKELVVRDLDVASWRKLAAILLSREKESSASFLSAPDHMVLMTSDKPGQTEERMSFLVDSMAGSSDKEDPAEGRFKLSSVVRLVEAIQRKDLQLEAPARSRLAGKIARDLPTCEGAVCSEAALTLVPWFKDLEATERTAFERQLIELAGDTGLPGITKLSTLCLRGWSPEGDVAAVREKVGGLLAAEREGSPVQLTSLAAWACLAESARPEERSAMAKRAARLLGLARPDHLEPVFYAFGKLKSALEKEDRRRAWDEIVLRLTKFGTVQAQEADRRDALTITAALSGESYSAEEMILQTVTAKVQALITSDPDPAHTIRWIRWYGQVTHYHISEDSPQWSDMSRAALARLERSPVKSWGVLLPEALPVRIAERNSLELGRYVALGMRQTKECSDLTLGLAALRALNPSVGCSGCFDAIKATLDQITPSGACNGDGERRLGQQLDRKRVQWAARHVDVGVIARRIVRALCWTEHPGQNERSWQEILDYVCAGDAMATCSEKANEIRKTGCDFPSLVDDVIARP